MPNVGGKIEGSRSSITLAICAGLLAIGAGLILVVLYGLYPERTANVVAALLLSGVCLFAGVLTGFLFGIPRSLQTNGSSPPPDQLPAADVGAQTPRSRVQYGANTNLEQISDWLTKILVGVGLTQLVTLPETLGKIGVYFGPAIGAHDNAPRVAVGIVVFFSVCGFLFGYLWTRLFLGSEFARADLNAITQQVREEISQAYEEDARAITLVTRYLSSRDWSKVPVRDLNDAIGKASAAFRAQVFNLANEVRSQSRLHDHSKPTLERTIPVFEALIATARDSDPHEYHGQLGYALKDLLKPDYRRAMAELTKAIDLRGPAFEIGWGLYEFNRAICRIKLNEEFAANRPSQPENRQQILADLRVAVEEFPDLLGDPDILKWLEINKVKDVRG
jgi:hypothetical protein